MRERPILFSGPMVRAILDGRKTQTRRVVKPQPVKEGNLWQLYGAGWSGSNCPVMPGHSLASRGPFGGPGDRLWVRETWAPMCRTADPHCWCADDPARQRNHFVEYRADTNDPYPGEWPAEDARGYVDAPKWRPSIHMPRWASRLTLEVTGVRVERLRDINGDDIAREGIETGLPAFRTLWNSLNKARGYGWDANPWVWVIDFAVVPAAVLQEATA